MLKTLSCNSSPFGGFLFKLLPIIMYIILFHLFFVWILISILSKNLEV